jgi:DNA-directed RNA polymerase specialized sigma24 family protein
LRRTARRPTRVALDLAQLEASWEEHGGHFPRYLEALRRCLPALDGRERVALEQRYRLGWSRQRMARALGLSVDGVKSILQRIRRRLRRDIERTLEESER